MRQRISPRLDREDREEAFFAGERGCLSVLWYGWRVSGFRFWGSWRFCNAGSDLGGDCFSGFEGGVMANMLLCGKFVFLMTD